MFERLRTRWNAAKQRRFEERVAKYLRRNFGEVMGSDARLLDESGCIDRLHEKYFGRGE